MPWTSFLVAVKDEVLPDNLHVRVRHLLLLDWSPVRVQESAGVVDLHLPSLLSQLTTQLGPLPLLRVSAVHPNLAKNQNIH